VISRNCFISQIIDQTGNGCLIYNFTASAIPDYMVDPTHSGLPRFIRVLQGAGRAMNFLLDNNGGNTGTLTNPCTKLRGGAQALFYQAIATTATFLAVKPGFKRTSLAVLLEGCLVPSLALHTRSMVSARLRHPCLVAALTRGRRTAGELQW
jgi:hypothetical protein